jgi:ubiquinone/menaquinone biosynthesis C-methylase UbiE
VAPPPRGDQLKGDGAPGPGRLSLSQKRALEKGFSKAVEWRQTIMAKNQEPNLHFKLMSLTYKFRDFFRPRRDILKEAEIQKGFHVLDYGCGPGSYIIPLADFIGPSGKIYALDIHPLALNMVKKRAAKKHLANVMTIQSDCLTGLPNGSIDVVLLYDVFHDLEHPEIVLKELHRVLKPDGILSFSDHHLQENDIVSGITQPGLFVLARKGPMTYSFRKIS